MNQARRNEPHRPDKTSLPCQVPEAHLPERCGIDVDRMLEKPLTGTRMDGMSGLASSCRDPWVKSERKRVSGLCEPARNQARQRRC